MMKAKEYLAQVGFLDSKLAEIDARIRRLQKEIRMMDDVSILSAWPDGQPHGTKTGDPTGNKASSLADKVSIRRQQLKNELLDLEYESIQARSRLWSKKMEVSEMIEKVMDPAEPKTRSLYDVLVLIYIDGTGFGQAADKMHYSIRQLYRIHDKAIERMEQILNG